MQSKWKPLILYLGMFNLLLLQGCASLPNDTPAPDDPLESMNRSIFSFNQDADRIVLRPVAEVYTKSLPEQLRISISNFFSNIGEIGVIANDLLQLKFEQAGRDTGRFLLNTSVGFLGFFDPATEYGVPRNQEDFGQTLGYWGVPAGPYLVLPFFGPSTVRDTTGMVVDSLALDPKRQINDRKVRNWLTYGGGTVQAIDTRAQLLGTENMLDSASTDTYLFLKNAYLQKRKILINDGKVENRGETISDDDLFGDL